MHLPSRKVIAGVLAGAIIAFSSVSSVGAASPLPTPGSGGTAGSGSADAARSTACATQTQAAKSDRTVANLRALGDCEIDHRFATLDRLSTAITSATTLSASDRSALTAIVGSARSGLTSLKATIDAETSPAALVAEDRRIVTDYRVYLLVAPQVRLVIAADRIAARAPALDRISANLASRITDAKAAGKDVAAAQGYLDAMNAAVAKSASIVGPVPGLLLPLTAAQYDSGTARPVLSAARADIVGARDQLEIATQDAKACRDALRDLR